MKFFCTALLVSIFITSCEPEYDFYETFVIPAGKHSGTYKSQTLQAKKLQFSAIFDSSAIYLSLTTENQWDTHKLMGFADCNSHHHENSARFGWRWLDDQLEILAYCYVGKTRIIEKVGTVEIGTENYYSIELRDSSYVFTLNTNPRVYIARASSCTKGAYYMLFPYFGGNEVAPHDIIIRIKQIY